MHFWIGRTRVVRIVIAVAVRIGVCAILRLLDVAGGLFVFRLFVRAVIQTVDHAVSVAVDDIFRRINHATSAKSLRRLVRIFRTCVETVGKGVAVRILIGNPASTHARQRLGRIFRTQIELFREAVRQGVAVCVLIGNPASTHARQRLGRILRTQIHLLVKTVRNRVVVQIVIGDTAPTHPRTCFIRIIRTQIR